MLPEEVYCPTCDKLVRSRDLRSVYVQTCRACGAELGSEEKFGSWNSDAAFASDVAAIDDWLDSVSGVKVIRERDREPMGEFIWDIRGLSIEGRCEVLYAKRMPDVVTVQLCIDVPSEQAMPKRSRHEILCSSHSVQPAGVTGSQNWWGAKQILSTAWLPATLFTSVVSRLAEVIRELGRRDDAES